MVRERLLTRGPGKSKCVSYKCCLYPSSGRAALLREDNCVSSLAHVGQVQILALPAPAVGSRVGWEGTSYLTGRVETF